MSYYPTYNSRNLFGGGSGPTQYVPLQRSSHAVLSPQKAQPIGEAAPPTNNVYASGMHTRRPADPPANGLAACESSSLARVWDPSGDHIGRHPPVYDPQDWHASAIGQMMPPHIQRLAETDRPWGIYPHHVEQGGGHPSSFPRTYATSAHLMAVPQHAQSNDLIQGVYIDQGHSAAQTATRPAKYTPWPAEHLANTETQGVDQINYAVLQEAYLPQNLVGRRAGYTPPEEGHLSTGDQEQHHAQEFRLDTAENLQLPHFSLAETQSVDEHYALPLQSISYAVDLPVDNRLSASQGSQFSPNCLDEGRYQYPFVDTTQGEDTISPYAAHEHISTRAARTPRTGVLHELPAESLQGYCDVAPFGNDLASTSDLHTFAACSPHAGDRDGMPTTRCIDNLGVGGIHLQLSGPLPPATVDYLKNIGFKETTKLNHNAYGGSCGDRQIYWEVLTERGKEYRCALCPSDKRPFKRRHEIYKRHILQVHMKRKLQCKTDGCNKSFQRRDQLVKHETSCRM